MGFFGLTQRRETRRAPRYDVDYLAHVDLHDDSPPVHVIICDISAHGARLAFGGRFELPDEVTLTFRRRCRVVRRGDGEIGVEFVTNSGQGKLEPLSNDKLEPLANGKLEQASTDSRTTGADRFSGAMRSDAASSR